MRIPKKIFFAILTGVLGIYFNNNKDSKASADVRIAPSGSFIKATGGGGGSYTTTQISYSVAGITTTTKTFAADGTQLTSNTVSSGTYPGKGIWNGSPTLY